MKAVRIHAYGGIEQVRIDDIPLPVPGPHQVRVAVRAAGSNPCDWKLRSGWHKDIVQLPMPTILGGDMAGVIDKVGSQVTAFAPGDRVYGMVGLTGAQAEYLVADAALVARMPLSLDFVHAAAVPLAALTAWQALDVAEIQPGQEVLIHAGAGGVGSFAVQFARHRGAIVTATASTANHKYLRQLGASRCLDYRTQDFEREVRNADVVLDLLGGDVGPRSFTCLRPGGVVVSVAGPPPSLGSIADGKRMLGVHVHPNAQQLTVIAALIDKGAVVVEVAKVFALDDAAAAHTEVERGHTRGKVVLKCNEPA